MYIFQRDRCSRHASLVDKEIDWFLDAAMKSVCAILMISTYGPIQQAGIPCAISAYSIVMLLIAVSQCPNSPLPNPCLADILGNA